MLRQHAAGHAPGRPSRGRPRAAPRHCDRRGAGSRTAAACAATRDQAERRGRIARAHHLAGRGKIPECRRREARIDQQYIRRARVRRSHRSPSAQIVTLGQRSAVVHALVRRFTAALVAALHRHLRCSQSHCSGCSRTHASTMPVITCIVPWMSILPSASRADVDLVGQLAPERVAVRPAHHAHAADRAFGVARKLRDQRIGFRPSAEEHHVDALDEMLVDQHADMLAALERIAPCAPARRVRSGSGCPCSRRASRSRRR